MNNWLVKNGLFLTLLSIIVAAISCLKEIVFANLFGVSNVADAYSVAITIPEVLFAVVWTAMNSILIPMYQEKIQNENKKEASRFISIFFTSIVLICTIFVVLSEAITDFWIYLFAPGFDEETHILAVSIARWVFPMLIFDGIERVCIGVLQTHKRFVFTKILSLVRNIFIVFFLIVFANKFSVFAAVMGVLVGVAIEALMAFIGSKNVEKIFFIFDFKDESLKRAGKLAVPIIIGTGVGELNLLTDKMVGSFLETGSLTAISYASRMEGIVTTIVLLNIVSLVFPFFSELVARKEMSELKIIFENTLRVILLLSIPIVIVGFILGKDVISIVFMRGAFDYQAVDLVAPLFSIYLFASLFNTVRTMSVNLFASFKETREIMINTILAVTVNIVFNIIFSKLWGAIGLACASLMSAVLASSRLICKINSSKFVIDFSELVIISFKALSSGFFMGVIIYVCKYWIENMFVLDTIYARAGEVFALIIVGVCAYICSLMVFRVREVKIVLERLSHRRISH